MTSRIEILRFGMDEENKSYVGLNVTNIKDIGTEKMCAIYNSINQNKAYKTQIDLDSLNYVVDELSNEGIIPAEYNEFIGQYNITPAYFTDYLPTLYKISFNDKDQNGLIYFLCTHDGYEKIFLNEDATEIFKTKTPEEISMIVTKAQEATTRSRK